ncbi:hypothetical protein [Flavitalea sp.]|nr:hypothetical protein [Flavitalea sp.]
MKFQLLSPTSTIDIPFKEFDKENVELLFTPGYSIHHLKNETFEGAANVHALDLRVTYLLSVFRDIILEIDIRSRAVLYNIPCQDFKRKVFDLHRLSYMSANLEFRSLIRKRIQFAHLTFPNMEDTIAGHADQITDIVDLLRASW